MSFLTQGVDGTTHEVHGSYGVVKTSVIGARIDQVGKSQLRDTTQTLEVGVVDQLVNKRIFYGNKPVDRVVNDFVLIVQNARFCQCGKNSTG
jgi:hypothetical protein